MKKIVACILLIVFICTCRFVDVFADDVRKITIINNDHERVELYDENKVLIEDNFECFIANDLSFNFNSYLKDDGTNELTIFSVGKIVATITAVPKEGYIFNKWIINGAGTDLNQGISSNEGDVILSPSFIKDTTFYWGIDVDNYSESIYGDGKRYTLLITESKDDINHYEKLKNGMDGKYYPLAGETNGIFYDTPIWSSAFEKVNSVKTVGNIYAPTTSRWFSYFYIYSDSGEGVDVTFDLSGLYGTEDASYMFDGCNNFSSINIIGFDTSKVKDMTSMYRGCFFIKKIGFGESFKTSNVLSFNSTFAFCNQLESIDISFIDTSNALDMSNMFVGCMNLEKLDLSNFNTKNAINMSYLFANCKKIKQLDLSSFDTSNVTSMMSMFHFCDNLESINLSSFNTSNVRNMYFMFSSCMKLKSIDLSNFDTSNVTRMDYIFDNCNSLESIDVSNFDTSKVISFDCMFSECQSLKELDLTSFTKNKDSIYSGAYMFANDFNLETIYTNKDFYLLKKGDISTCFGYGSSSEDPSYFCYKLRGEKGSYIAGYDEETGKLIDIDDIHCMYHQVERKIDCIENTYARIDDPDNGKPGYFTRGYYFTYKYDDGTKKKIVGKINTEIELEKPEKDGYTFMGWSDGTNIYTDTYVLTKEGVILSPIWKKNYNPSDDKPSDSGYTIPKTGI